MKKNTHPDYGPVVFDDPAGNFRILTKSTIRTDRTVLWEDGNTYPYVVLDVSSATHPAYTGKRANLRDTEGRIERFNAKYGDRKKPT